MSKKLMLLVLVCAVMVTTVQAAVFITSVAHRNTDTDAPEAPQIAPNPLDEDEPCYVDRVHQYNEIPQYLIGADYIMLANDNKNQSIYELDITLSQNATLYVFVDNRMGGAAGGLGVNPNITGMPWLTEMGFVDTGDDIGIDEGADGSINQYSSIFSLGVKAGTVTIFGNTQGHGGNMLGVAVMGPKLMAYGPVPADGAIHADTWVSLGWTSGDTAASHDVYFGESFADVNDGIGDTFRGNQIANFYIVGFPGFPYPDGLVPGTTYYWRIDEVEANGTTKHKGNVWSFTIPPKKAYNPDPANDAEGVALNATLKWTPGFGAKLHTVFFGDNFDNVNNATAGIPQGSPSYSPGALKFAKTYYWRIDEFDGTATYKGDVWSFTTQGAVGNPNPANGAAGVEATPTLTWNPGALAASHELYFGIDLNAVKNATKSSPEYKGTRALGDESYDPGVLTLETTYYWRIDEVNNPNPDSPWKGNVWSFTTGNFYVVDDFESYNDIDPPDPASNRIFDNWIDGFGTTNNGALVGNDLPPYAEQAIVHGGGQSMPYRYDNNGKSSEAVLTLTAPRNWTTEGISELSIWFRGNSASVGSFVEGPAGTYTMTAAGADIWGTADQFHFAYKTLSGIGSIEAKVESVQNTNAWAKCGVMIRDTLDAGSKFAAVYITPTNADGTPTNGCRFQARTDTDASATSDSSVATNAQKAVIAPYWIKLEREITGNFRGYYSSNGTSWTPMAWNPQSISMGANVYIGLALTSHNAGATCTAKFSNVKTTGTVGLQWAHQDIGIASNAAEPLYVAVSNSNGKTAVVINDNPAAANITTWTQWIVPLQTFADQGVNLTNVDKIAIGMGTKGSTAAGGSGKMFFDDIRLYRPAP